MLHLRILSLFLLAAIIRQTTCTNQAYDSRNIYEATYSYPIVNDSSIFNVNHNASDHDILPTQLQGRFYWPRSAVRENSVPLVLMFSGKHPDCRRMVDVDQFGPYPVDGGAVSSQGLCPPNETIVQGYRGFDYLGRQLAASGFAAISIDPLLLNNPSSPPENDPYLSAARARLLLKTIEKVRSWDRNPKESLAAIGYDISRSLNLSSIGLMGHSRGGAGARLAYNMVMTPQRLPVEEIFDWSSHLNVSIRAVMEVAPLDVVEQHTFTAVVGSPWVLVGAGCESDEIDYAYYRLVQRQSRLNDRPNFFLNVYGASHEYFNTEWHQAIDACLGDQKNTWNISAPHFNLSTHTLNVSVPLVLGAEKQQEALSYPLLNFFQAYLGRSEKPKLMETFKAAANRSTLSLSNGVAVGLSNPNIVSSTPLQDFTTSNLSDIVNAPKDFLVEAISDHAMNLFPVFQSQVSQFGLPKFYNTLLGTSNTSSFNFSLAKNAIYDQGVVISLPKRIQEPATIQISLNTSLIQERPTQECSIHVDLARRGNCFLPSAASDNGPGTLAAKRCVKPRELIFRSQVRAFSANYNHTITATPLVKLKSRFNFEWGPYNVSSSLANEVDIGLLPVAWETIVLDESRDSNVDWSDRDCASGNSILELTFDTTSDDSRVETKVENDKTVSEDFLYIGVVRRIC